MISVTPAVIASLTAYSTKGVSNIGIISLGIDLVAGKNLVPKPATGRIAFLILLNFYVPCDHFFEEIIPISAPDNNPPR
jgi:hypothetical protein